MPLSQEIENFAEIFRRYENSGCRLEYDACKLFADTLMDFARQAQELEPQVDPLSLPPMSDADFGRIDGVIPIKGAR